MTEALLVAAFTLLFVPVVETLWDPLWARKAAGAPAECLRSLRVRMAGGLLAAGLLAAGLLAAVSRSRPTHPFLPVGSLPCVSHDLGLAPGGLTVGLLATSVAGLAVVVAALFYPLPGLPAGRPRPDLAALIGARGVDVTVEVLPDGEPACFSEVVPYPRVVLLGDIEARLSASELRAILDHEAAHLAAGDHRARVWARAYRRLLFWFPGARVLFDAFVHQQERRADDQVVRWRPSGREALRGALVALATGGTGAARSGGAGAAGGGARLGELGAEAWSVQQRIARLSGRSEGTRRGISWRAWPFLALALAVFVMTSEAGACTLHCLVAALP